MLIFKNSKENVIFINAHNLNPREGLCLVVDTLRSRRAAGDSLRMQIYDELSAIPTSIKYHRNSIQVRGREGQDKGGSVGI